MSAVVVLLLLSFSVLAPFKDKINQLFFPKPPSHAAAVYEIWLSPNSTGKEGDGSQASPYDASSQVAFDNRISSLGTQPVIIHLLQGTFQTHGLTIRSGWHIVGAGMDNTKILYTGSASITGVISSFLLGDDSATNMLVSDLTVDGGGRDGDKRIITGVVLRGKDYNTIENVKVVNASAPSNEAFIVWILDAGSWDD